MSYQAGKRISNAINAYKSAKLSHDAAPPPAGYSSDMQNARQELIDALTEEGASTLLDDIEEVVNGTRETFFYLFVFRVCVFENGREVLRDVVRTNRMNIRVDKDPDNFFHVEKAVEEHWPGYKHPTRNEQWRLVWFHRFGSQTAMEMVSHSVAEANKDHHGWARTVDLRAKEAREKRVQELPVELDALKKEFESNRGVRPANKRDVMVSNVEGLKLLWDHFQQKDMVKPEAEGPQDLLVHHSTILGLQIVADFDHPAEFHIKEFP